MSSPISQNQSVLDKIVEKIDRTVSDKQNNYFTYTRQMKSDVKYLRDTVSKFKYPPKFFVMETGDFFCLVLAGITFTYSGNATGSIRTKSFKKEDSGLVPDSKRWEFATIFIHDLYSDTEKDKKIRIAKLDAVMKRLSKMSDDPNRVIEFVKNLKNKV